MTALPEPTAHHLTVVRQMRAYARRGWYTGDMESLAEYGAVRDVTGVVDAELRVKLLLSRDRMHHSVGWWRNAEYEYCWHLSISAKPRVELLTRPDNEVDYADLPRDEIRFWGRLVFGDHADKVWHEPGGTDPRLTPGERHAHSKLVHLRLFLDPETMEPFIPAGEVYDLTRWIDGLTPEKVDR